jgi:uncharacterized membrane protein YraQ (UPF0718 family)
MQGRRAIMFVLCSELIKNTLITVMGSLIHNWIPLSLAIITGTIMDVHIDQEKVKQYLINKPKLAVCTDILFGALTPLCACGTMAIVIGMLTTTLPYRPVIDYLTSSPLMNPDGFMMLTDIVNSPFAVALTIGSVIIGLGSGYITLFTKKPLACCSALLMQICACTANQPKTLLTKLKLNEMADSVINLGIKQIVWYFSLFIAVGYLINYFVPASYIMALFDSSSVFAVPIATIIGLPVYVTPDSAVPLIKALMEGGASAGAMLAFMITGQATSAWVISGLLPFMKIKVITLYILFVTVCGIALGYLLDLYLFFAK